MKILLQKKPIHLIGLKDFNIHQTLFEKNAGKSRPTSGLYKIKFSPLESMYECMNNDIKAFLFFLIKNLYLAIKRPAVVSVL